jgi:DNA ligase-1
MKSFSQLYSALDETTKTNSKIEALVKYFGEATPEDAIWAISFLVGRKPRQIIPTRKLRQWAAELAQVPDWLFDTCYDIVGDLAETITLLLPRSTQSSEKPLHLWVEDNLLPLRDKEESIQQKEMVIAWSRMDTLQRFIWNKLITGGFRVGVSKKLVIRSLSRFTGIDESVLAHRLMGKWKPEPATYFRMISTETDDADISRPYPFFLAHPLDDAAEKLGKVSDWQAEWKWDGIRGQIINREEQVFIWSRGEELVTDKFPEITDAGRCLPDGTAIDGEILPGKDGLPLNFSELQRRIGRKNLTAKILKEVPVMLIAYDLLEYQGEDVREKPLKWRRKTLEKVIAEIPSTVIFPSRKITAISWQKLEDARLTARERGAEGLMLKRLDSTYRVGRKRGDWWKWKVDPFTVDAVLIYAQRGHGRRSGLYTDYTFAIWNNDTLVPFAKAYSGLTDAEIRQVDRFIQRNTIEKFGPVRSVKPELVFEVAFEGIQKSTRHKSGIAVRFPRMSRWRKDKMIEEADTLETVKALLAES